MSVDRSIIENKVEKLTECGCWIWMGTTTNRGYGQIERRGKKYYAHRMSYSAFKGDIPSGMNVCHSCDITFCVNPDHLFVGTQKDNLSDMAKKGRSTIGERNPRAKLTKDQVMKIRQTSANKKEIADMFNISRRTVDAIKSGKRWANV